MKITRKTPFEIPNLGKFESAMQFLDYMTGLKGDEAQPLHAYFKAFQDLILNSDEPLLPFYSEKNWSYEKEAFRPRKHDIIMSKKEYEKINKLHKYAKGLVGMRNTIQHLMNLKANGNNNTVGTNVALAFLENATKDSKYMELLLNVLNIDDEDTSDSQTPINL